MDGVSARALLSALVLLSQELDFYHRRGRALLALRGFPVRRGSRELGTLLDLFFASDGDLTGFLLEQDATERTVTPGPGMTLGPDALRPAV